MLFKKFIPNLILSGLLMILFENAYSDAITNRCGNQTITVKTFHESDLAEMRYELYYGTKKKILFYKTNSGVFFHVACLKNNDKKEIILFQEYCYGNGCPEDTFGIFDVEKKKLLISPQHFPRGNSRQVTKLLGFQPPDLGDDNRSFCCELRSND